MYLISGELTLPESQTTWVYDALTLRKGSHYSIQLTAVNGAGLAAVHHTTGVTVDPTPPLVITHFRS